MPQDLNETVAGLKESLNCSSYTLYKNSEYNYDRHLNTTLIGRTKFIGRTINLVLPLTWAWLMVELKWEEQEWKWAFLTLTGIGNCLGHFGINDFKHSHVF